MEAGKEYESDVEGKYSPKGRRLEVEKLQHNKWLYLAAFLLLFSLLHSDFLMPHKRPAGRQLSIIESSRQLTAGGELTRAALHFPRQGEPPPRGDPAAAEGGRRKKKKRRGGKKKASAAGNLKRKGSEDPGADGGNEEDGACRKMLWFTAVGGERSGEYEEYLLAAMLSARQYAPSLVPVLLYAMEPTELTSWFIQNGGHVIHHNLSFLSVFEKETDPVWREELLRSEGTYLRLDIPMVVDQILEEGLLDMSNVSTRYALYTDVDVMFMGGGPGSPPGDVSTCTVPLPAELALGPEQTRAVAWNAGVMLINLPWFRREVPAMLRFAEEQNFHFKASVHDQGLLLQYMWDFNKSLEVLPDRLDWKGYWGSDPQATILHWHGPKPYRCVPCFLEHRHEDDWTAPCKRPDTYCPPIYLNMLSDAKRADGGEMFVHAVESFHGYVKQGREGGTAAAAEPAGQAGRRALLGRQGCGRSR